MGKKTTFKLPLNTFKKMQKNVEKLLMKLMKMKKQTMYNILMLVGIFVVLYFVKTYYLATEGFECAADKLPENISKNDKVLVLFYADWCGHCKKFMPKWDEYCAEYNGSSESSEIETEGENMDDALKNAIQQVQSESSSKSNKKMLKVNCGDVNNESHVKIMKQYNIKGYPTILEIKKNGEFSEYEGGKDKDSIFNFLGMN